MEVAQLDDWPELPYQVWRETCDTLHMYAQVVGKLRLALSPFEPEWAHVPLYVTARGLTTSPLRAGLRTIDVEIDLVDHVLVIRDSAGLVERRPLGGTVADFYRDVMAALHRMSVDVTISTLPSEVPDPIRFPDDDTHHTYDAESVARFHRALTTVDVVMKEHRAHFRGRTTPVQFFWGTFDLAISRFSGRPAQAPAGAGLITRLSEDAEEICAGWWPGDERMPYAAFYAYAYPAPAGIGDIDLRPSAASWRPDLGMFVLPYDAVRSEADPRQAVLDFLASTYGGAAGLSGWDPSLADVQVPQLSKRPNRKENR
ncbi:MAG: DUF5996 family protein [Candidatus Dormibacteraeota bacterium]|nr:DUF5996 family protein [Candidatus Dormibacteraeota bacterium]